MKKSILLITYGRKEELFETLYDIEKYKKDDLELLVLDNNQTNELKKEIENIFMNSKIILRYFHDGINYGVALGRNYIIKEARGDILITLDDDIQILDIERLIEKIEEYFYSDNKLGCLAFNIKNYYTRKALRHEIPHGNKKLNFNENLETYYYIGAGHAIKKEVYDNCGLYPDDLGKYGGEENDLSFRIIEKYNILYCADLEIYHKVSPNGRMLKKDENYFRYRNKMIVVKKYLPTKYIITNGIIWSLYFFIKNRKINLVMSTLKELFKIKNNKISKKTLLKLKTLGARLTY